MHDTIDHPAPSREACQPALDRCAVPADTNDPAPASAIPGGPDPDLAELLAQAEEMTAAIAALRSGELVLDGSRDDQTLRTIFAGLQTVVRFKPRVTGAIAALTNAHYRAGGVHKELACALGENRSSAAKRFNRKTVRNTDWLELWALGETVAAEHPARDLRPGWTVVDADGERRQIQTVHVRADGRVEALADGGQPLSYDGKEQAIAVPHPAPFRRTTGRIAAEDGSDIDVVTYARPDGVPSPAPGEILYELRPGDETGAIGTTDTWELTRKENGATVATWSEPGLDDDQAVEWATALTERLPGTWYLEACPEFNRANPRCRRWVGHT